MVGMGSMMTVRPGFPFMSLPLNSNTMNTPPRRVSQMNGIYQTPSVLVVCPFETPKKEKMGKTSGEAVLDVIRRLFAEEREEDNLRG
jgi:hypothetical protein